MEKYLKLLFISLFATLTLTLNSCSDKDDEPDDTEFTLVGAWKIDVLKVDNNNWQTIYMRLSENGNYLSVSVVNANGIIYTAKESGKWSKKGDYLIIDGDKAEIIGLTKNKLVVSVDDQYLTFIKCPMAEMNKYL